MSTEITRPIEVWNPTTGELLDLTAPTDDLGRFLADVRELEELMRESKRFVSQELLARMDKQAKWTFHSSGLKLSGDSPAPVEEWNGAELRTALLELVDAGVIAIEAVDAAVETVVSYHPKKAGINQLRKLGGAVAETIDGLARQTERTRRVTVSRA
jgi:hypothetical protein